MQLNDMFPSSYLKCEDLKGRKVTLTIQDVEVIELGGERKPLITFQGKDRGLVLNKTNANYIAEILGSRDTEDWRGREITLKPAKAEFQGKLVDCIRVHYDPNAAMPVPSREPGEDDDIPF